MAGITHLKEFSQPVLQQLVRDESEQFESLETVGNRFLPIRPVYSNTFAYDVIKKKQHIASYIGYGAEPPVIDRDAVARRHGELAKLGLKHIVTEEELLAIHQARSSAENRDMVDRLVAKGIDLVNAVNLQIEISRLKALFTGQFEFNNNGVKIQVDYGVENTETPDTVWSDTSAAALSDLIKWHDNYVNRTGQRADVIFMSAETRGLLQRNEEIIGEIKGINASNSSRVSVAELEGLLSEYELPAIEVVTQRSRTVHNVVTGESEVLEYFPVGRLVFASEGLGEYQLGITVENGFAPGINLEAYDKNEPIQSVLRTVAAGFPVIENPDLLTYVDVTTP